MKKLYIGNLPFSAEDDSLLDLAKEHTQATKAIVIKDRETGRSRGFGFVELSDDADIDSAIGALNGLEMDGRPLKVNQARERTDRR